MFWYLFKIQETIQSTKALSSNNQDISVLKDVVSVTLLFFNCFPCMQYQRCVGMLTDWEPCRDYFKYRMTTNLCYDKYDCM